MGVKNPKERRGEREREEGEGGSAYFASVESDPGQLFPAVEDVGGSNAALEGFLGFLGEETGWNGSGRQGRR